MVVIGSSASTAAHLRGRLGPGVADILAHRLVEDLHREPFVDAIVLDGGDLIDGTAAVRRATAAPLLVIGGDPRVGATCLGMGADAWLAPYSAPNLVAAQVEALVRRRPITTAETTRKVGRRLELAPPSERRLYRGTIRMLADVDGVPTVVEVTPSNDAQHNAIRGHDAATARTSPMKSLALPMKSS